jgi:hypothetical protein
MLPISFSLMPGYRTLFRKSHIFSGTMRYLTARIISILFIGSFALSMFAMLPAKRTVRLTCSCPMCRANAPGHQCTCCMKSKTCTCRMSSDTPDQPPPRAAKLGVFSAAKIRMELPDLEMVVPNNLFYLPQFYSTVPTPPPKP